MNPVDHFRNVETIFVVQPAIDVSESNYFVAGLVHQIGRHGADVTEALNHDAASLFLDAQLGQSFVAADHHATAGSFLAAARTAQLDRLAGHNRGGSLAGMH